MYCTLKQVLHKLRQGGLCAMNGCSSKAEAPLQCQFQTLATGGWVRSLNAQNPTRVPA